MKIEFTEWETEQLRAMLGSENLNKAPLSVVREALSTYDKFEKSGKIELSETQLRYVYTSAMNPKLNWPVNQNSLDLYDKLQKAFDKLKKKAS